MKYWLYKAEKKSVQIYVDTLEMDYVNQTIYSDATGKEGKIVGNLEDDYPVFGAITKEVFSQRIAETIMGFDPEGVNVYPITLKLPDGTLNTHFYRLAIAPHVDCIDFDASELELDEDDGSIFFADDIVLDTDKADRAGYDLFRLHDRFPIIVMSDRMKQAIEALNPVGMDFEPTDGSDLD